MTNRVDALLSVQQDDEGAAIEKLSQLTRVQGAESRAAEIVADRVLRGLFRYNPGMGWMEWDGRRWDSDDVAEPRILEAVRQFVDTTEKDYRAKEVAASAEIAAMLENLTAQLSPGQMVTERGRQLLSSELMEAHSEGEDAEQFKKVKAAYIDAKQQADMWLNLLSSAKLNALVKLCRGMEGIVTRASEFDSYPDVLNCLNGIVDLRNGKLWPHDPKALLTQLAGADYIPDFCSELFELALRAVQPECLHWFQMHVGQSATGHTPDDDKLIVSEGSGENGKSAVKSILFRALGSYAKVLSHKVLTASPDAHPTELMDLMGCRFALLEETPEEGRLDTHRVKITIGTPYITARRMRRDPVTFKTSHTLWINTNHLPLVDTTDHGTWRRLRAMPWLFRFITLQPGEVWIPWRHEAFERQGDPGLKRKLDTDPTVATAALAWIVEGAMRWYAAEGQMPEDPATVVEATARWRQQSDVGYQFASEYLTADHRSFITADAMYTQFGEFLKQQGKKQWSRQLINTRLPGSLTAAGIQVDRKPDTPTKVRDGDIQSFPNRPSDRWSGVQLAQPSREPLAPGTQVRMWRGVRFKTEAEQQAGNLVALG